MTRPACDVDVEACIDWFFLGIGDFLKNGYTMTLLALTLIALLRVRAREQQKIRDRHAQQLLKVDDHRSKKHQVDVQAWRLDAQGEEPPSRC